MIRMTTNDFLIMGGVLLVLDVILFYLVRVTFQREEILTKWK